MNPFPTPPMEDEAGVAWLMSLVAAAGDVLVRTPAQPPTMATRLREGLGLDSIGVVTLFYAVADALELQGDEQEVASWETVGDVVSFARARSAARA